MGSHKDGDEVRREIRRLDAVNKTSLVNPRGATTAGFHCAVCSVTFSAYDAYLDHCNSRVHLTNAGLAPVERVDDVERIRQRLEQLRRKKASREASGASGDAVATERMIEERITQRRAQEEQRRQKQQQAKATKTADPTAISGSASKGEAEDQDEEAALMASVLGISSFK